MPQCDLEFYENVDIEFYEEEYAKRSKFNFIANWFHNRRQEIVNKWVKKNTTEGMKVLDMACGTCTWNTEGLPITGVDINNKMLEYAKSKGRLKDIIKADITKTGLPANSADVIILGDVLEHMTNYPNALKEAYKLLKKDGTLFVSVPYDTPLSLWWPLFNGYCLFKGFICGSKHHKVFAGHVIHFSPKNIRNAIKDAGFKIGRQFHNKRFTIYTIAHKN